jgi:transcriptional regulator with XRE-family HTH domain
VVPAASQRMLRRVRADRELTHEQLAVRIDSTPAWIEALECARSTDLTLATVSLLAFACEVSVALFVASFALPIGEPLPWPRAHRPPGDPPGVRLAGPRAFGATLRDERYRLNWTMVALADRAGLRPAKIGQLERGQVAAPALLAVTRLARALADTPPAQIAHATQLAQSYAGEIAPRRDCATSHNPTCTSRQPRRTDHYWFWKLTVGDTREAA